MVKNNVFDILSDTISNPFIKKVFQISHPPRLYVSLDALYSFAVLLKFKQDFSN